MKQIAIISSSVRKGRKSHRVARYFQHYLEERKLAAVTMLDLAEYGFPVFEERLRLLASPPEGALAFAREISRADGIILVTPEYNGGYPASLKNVIDLLYDEWYRKPIALSTVSGGSFGGQNVITSLQYTLWKMRAWTVPAQFPVPKVGEAFDEQGVPADKEATDKRAAKFIEELMWCMEVKKSKSHSS
jgi:NAD(P)H-dependent FMN reductase